MANKIVVSLPEKFLEDVDRVAAGEQRTRSELVREALLRLPSPGDPRRPLVEVSGGVSLATVRAYAEAGADLISVGALTHSVTAADLSLEVEA